MKLRWFYSEKVRQAADLCKQVKKMLNAQRDILSSQAIEAISGALHETQTAINSNVDKEALEKSMVHLQETSGKWFKPYPNAGWRENVEVFLVAIVVAMAIRTFFLQPFKIPTGSMEPTLFGIEVQDLRDQPDFKMPNPLERVWDFVYYGTIYHQVVAPQDGQVVQIGRLDHSLHVNKQVIWVQYAGGQPVPITIWLGPDDHLAERIRTRAGDTFRKGEPIVQFKETTGDHLFVDRMTYNFRHPHRGEVIVFKTAGIEGIPNPDQFYIKRLIGLPGETISIGEDRHVRINGQRLDASTPHFENLYGFDPNSPPRDGVSGKYSGHLLDSRSRLSSPSDTLVVPPGGFAAFGDNTVNSLDSRYWGWLPEENVIGKAFFVYWPFSSQPPFASRFGLVLR